MAVNPLRPNNDLNQSSHCNIKGVSDYHPSVTSMKPRVRKKLPLVCVVGSSR